MTEPVLRASDVVVRFPSFTLGPISFSVAPGELVCLLGPNGSGKTTLLNSLLGLLPLDGGSIAIDGRDPALRDPATIRQLGWVSETADDLLEDLTGHEYWDLHRYAYALAGCRRESMESEERRLSERLSFEPPIAIAATYSQGMKQKTRLIAGMMHEPQLIILDEPMNALDPMSVIVLQDVLEQRRADGAAVVLATHNLHYAARHASRLMVLRNGSVAGLGTSEELGFTGSQLEESFVELISH